MASLQSSGSIISRGGSLGSCDQRVGSFGASCHESHQFAFDCSALFLPEAGNEAFSVACVGGTGEVSMEVPPRELYMHSCRQYYSFTVKQEVAGSNVRPVKL